MLPSLFPLRLTGRHALARHRLALNLAGQELERRAKSFAARHKLRQL
jgi:hypothetical protein